MRHAAVSDRPVDRSQSSLRDDSAIVVSSRAGQPRKQGRKRKTSTKSRSSSSNSSSSDSSSSSNDSSDDERKRKKRRKREKREKKRLRKKEKKRLKRERKQKRLSTALQDTGGDDGRTEEIGPVIPERGVGQAMRPMTKEEWEKQSSQLRYVVDTDTGRKRLIRGSGEIVEEMVSARRHQQINKQATRIDGENFQKTINKMVAK